mgnify:CR=1 FL=1
MAVNLKGRSFLTLMDFTPEEIRYMLDLAHDLKAKKRSGIQGEMLKGKISFFCLTRHRRGPGVPSRWHVTMKALT